MQLIDQLLSVLQKKKLSVLKFSNETGISSDKIYQWKAKRGNPKAEDTVVIQNWLLKNTGKEIKEVKEDENVLHELEVPYMKTENHSSVDPLALIAKLINQNEVLTNAIAQSVSNEKEAIVAIKNMSESNAEISRSILNSNAQPGSHVIEHSMQDDFLLLLGNRVLGTKFERLDEAFAALHTPEGVSVKSSKSMNK